MERLATLEKQIEESKTSKKSDTLTITDNRTGKFILISVIFLTSLGKTIEVPIKNNTIKATEF